MLYCRAFVVRCWLGVASIGALGACSSEKAEEPEEPSITVGRPVPSMFGNSAAGTTHAGTGGLVVAPTAGAGGAGAAGTAGNSMAAGGASGAAGRGGSGVGGGSASSGSGGAEADAGLPFEDDPFGLFGPMATSCEGFLCVEAADCAALYPDEASACKFTSCVDFVCQ